MEKKKKWMIFGGTAVVVVGVFLCIAAFFLYKGVTLFFDREIVADQYLEQMTSAASRGTEMPCVLCICQERYRKNIWKGKYRKMWIYGAKVS